MLSLAVSVRLKLFYVDCISSCLCFKQINNDDETNDLCKMTESYSWTPYYRDLGTRKLQKDNESSSYKE